MSAKKKYDVDSLENFEGLEALRKRPGMYIGPTDSNGIWILCKEAADNTTDEFLSGRNKSCHIIQSPDNSIWILDEGNGIPVGNTKLKSGESINSLTMVVSKLHAGGKFGKGAYSAAIGCFSGATEIELVDGRVLSFVELHAEHESGKVNYVWTVDRKNGNLRAQPIERVLMTGYSSEMIKVKLNTGESFTCTPNHPLYQTSLKKIKAEDSVGKSLLSAKFSLDKDGYRTTGYTRRISQRLNRVVADYYGLDIDKKHVHHKNENKIDNTPENLDSLTPVQHYTEHPEKLELWMKYVVDTAHEKSKLLTEQNLDDDFQDKALLGRALRVGCRLVKEGLRITHDSYDAYRGHSSCTYASAISVVGSEKEFRRLAKSVYSSALYGAKLDLSYAKDFLKSLNYAVGLSKNSVVYNSSTEMTVKRIIGKAVNLLAKLDKEELNKLTPEKLNKFLNGKVGGRSLCQYIDLEEFISAVQNEVNPLLFVYSDVSPKACLIRQHKWDEDYANAIAKNWKYATTKRLANDFLRKINSMLDDGVEVNRATFHKRYVNACGKSMWYTGRAACYKLGIDSKKKLLKAAKKANHKVVSVERISYSDAIPVYDLSVSVDHNYRLACGVFVGNTHGIGIKATNALSEMFEVYTNYEGKWWHTAYSKGKETSPVKKAKAPPVSHGIEMKRGTAIHFKPDMSIFSKGSKFIPAMAAEWCRLTAYLNAGYKTTLTDATGKTKTWCYKNGVRDYLTAKLELLKTKSLGRNVFQHADETMDIAVAFTNYDGIAFEAYTNSSKNVDGGVHVTAFYSALSKAIEPYKLRSHKFTPSDLREGLVGIINYKIAEPQFSSQTKEKLTDTRVAKPCEETCFKALKKFFDENKTLAKEICKRAAELKSLKDQFAENKKALQELSKAAKGGKFHPKHVRVDCPDDIRELYLVEGDSALGCFVATTEIMLADGNAKTIHQLVNDAQDGKTNTGLSYNIQEGRFEEFEIKAPRITKLVDEVIELTLDSGDVITCTSNHKFLLITGEYKQAQDLTEDDVIQEF